MVPVSREEESVIQSGNIPHPKQWPGDSENSVFMPEGIKGKMDKERKKWLDSLSDDDPVKQEDSPSRYKSLQLGWSLCLAAPALMTLTRDFDFEITAQQSFGFLISDYQAAKALKLPISSGKKKKKNQFLTLGRCFSMCAVFWLRRRKLKG